jgi:hypothetical protein
MKRLGDMRMSLALSMISQAPAVSALPGDSASDE